MALYFTKSVSGTIAADTVVDVDITGWSKAPTGILNGMVTAWQTLEYDARAHGYGDTVTDLTVQVVRIIKVTCADNKMTLRLANTDTNVLNFVITVTAIL